MTVVNRLLVSGSDRFCERWRRDYYLPGCEHLELHHLYRAMGFLGEELSDQTDATPFTPRRTKDRIEELLFARNRDLFSELELVFFDTTSIYFEGGGGAHFGRRGFSKDHRPDLFQMVVGAVLDGNGRPISNFCYRVNSKRGTQFRIWATNVLREHLVRGFTLNEKRLREQGQKLSDLHRTVGLLEKTLAHRAIGLDEAKGLLQVITDYAYALTTLDRFDHGTLTIEEVRRPAP